MAGSINDSNLFSPTYQPPTTDWLGRPVAQSSILPGLQGLGSDLQMQPNTGWGEAPVVSGGPTVQPLYTNLADAGSWGNYFGANAGMFAKGFDILGKGISAYTGLKALGVAKDSLALEKKRFKTNLANQTSSYNTQVADRINGRSYASEAERQAALLAAQLPSTPEKKKGG